MDSALRFPVTMLTTLALVTVWSAIAPHDRFTWWLETMPVFIAVALLAIMFRQFPFTHLLYALIALHAVILLVGGHYTYAKVPVFDWLSEQFGWGRNYYDRVGHFAQGFVPAMVARELLLRTSPLKAGKWMFALIVLGCLGISAIYEIIEWLVAAFTGEAAESFLGTQGDVWDTQKDMLWAGIGACLSLLLLRKTHDRQLKKLQESDTV